MDLVTGLLSFAKQSPFKLVIILAIISALSGVYVWHINKVETAGYNKAKVEIYEDVERKREEREKQFQADLKSLRDKLKTTKQESQENKNKAVELQKLLTNRPTVEVFRDISSIETECVDLGVDFGRVLHNIISDAPTIDHQ